MDEEARVGEEETEEKTAGQVGLEGLEEVDSSKSSCLARRARTIQTRAG